MESAHACLIKIIGWFKVRLFGKFIQMLHRCRNRGGGGGWALGCPPTNI